MKRIALIAALIATPALAQQQPAHQEQALGQEVMECVGGKVQLRARVAQLEAELAKMKAPKDDAK